MRSLKSPGSQREGVAAVEAAVVIPLLVLLVVVAVDFARVFYYALTLENAALSGAIYAGNHPDHAANTAEIENVALADASNLSPPPGVDSFTEKDVNGNLYVTVTVKWNFNTVVPYPGIPRPFPLQRSVKVRVAQENPDE